MIGQIQVTWDIFPGKNSTPPLTLKNQKQSRNIDEYYEYYEYYNGYDAYYYHDYYT